jgi:antitoxin component YwqK of YwqJK toxin-antitoxin module
MAEKKNGIIVEYYYEKIIKLRKKYFVFNGKQEGEYNSYYINGQQETICNYKNGNLEGEHKTYWITGHIFIIWNYKNNKNEG